VFTAICNMMQWLKNESKGCLWHNLTQQYMCWVSEINAILISVFLTTGRQLQHCHCMYLSVTSSIVALFLCLGFTPAVFGHTQAFLWCWVL
jgi:hypothetical protein